MISRFAYLRAEISTGSCHDEEIAPKTCPKTATVLMQTQRACADDRAHLSDMRPSRCCNQYVVVPNWVTSTQRYRLR